MSKQYHEGCSVLLRFSGKNKGGWCEVRSMHMETIVKLEQAHVEMAEASLVIERMTAKRLHDELVLL